MDNKSDNHSNEQVEALTLELRRGTIVLAVLSQLQEEQYGYSLIKELTGKGFDIDQGTLYPLLRRLETQELLQSEWRVEESRPRRYYLISQVGRQVLPALKAEWEKLAQTMQRLI